MLRHPAEQLVAALDSGTLVVAGIWDPLGALIAEKSGAAAVYLSGYTLAASYGRRDIGLTTSTEIIRRADEIVQCSKMPLIVDMDQGFGSVGNATLTFNALERVGVAAVQIEDQPFPPKSASYAGVRLISVDEMNARIGAIKQSRTTPTLLIARTDSLPFNGINDAAERLQEYVNAGADLVMPLGARTGEDLTRLAESFPRRWILVVSEGSPQLSEIRPLSDYLPYQPAMIIYSSTMLRRYCRALQLGFAELKRDGMSTFDENNMVGTKELESFISLSKFPFQND
jgi:2-methylisocitrate lyase-like PEP mutase family enzyme